MTEWEEKRENKRAPLLLTIELKGDIEGRKETIELGLTRNISAGGAYLSSANWDSIEVGSEVGITISAPCRIQNSLHFIQLEGKAIVVRKDDLPEKTATRRGVALRFGDKLTLVECE